MGRFEKYDFRKEMEEYDAYASSMLELGKDPITGEDLEREDDVEDLLDAMGYGEVDSDSLDDIDVDGWD